MIRLLLAGVLGLGTLSVSALAQELPGVERPPYSQGAPYSRRLGPPPGYYPPPPAYYPAPQVRLGYTCQTRRFECDLRRPRPVGEDCECRSPAGELRSGVVQY